MLADPAETHELDGGAERVPYRAAEQAAAELVLCIHARFSSCGHDLLQVFNFSADKLIAGRATRAVGAPSPAKVSCHYVYLK
jgi:hypothetical protein